MASINTNQHYFSIVPNVRVGFPGSKNTWDQEYVVMKNIFRRTTADFNKVKGFLSFEKYVIAGDDKPYQVSQRIYGSPKYEWVILLTNNIVNVYTQWPRSNDEFNDYFRKKYGTQGEGLHHYVTREIVFENVVVVKEGTIVDKDYRFILPNHTVISGPSLVRPVSNYEYEYEKNEEKREIYLINPLVIDDFIREMERKLAYQFSSDITNQDVKDSSDDDELFYKVKVFDTESDPDLE